MRSAQPYSRLVFQRPTISILPHGLPEYGAPWLCWSLQSEHPQKGGLQASLIVYLGMLAQYLAVVWFLHIGGNGDVTPQIKSRLLHWTPLFSLGGIYISVAHFRFVRIFSQTSSRILYWLEILGWIALTPIAFTNVTGRLATDYEWKYCSYFPTMNAGYAIFGLLTACYLTASLLVPAVRLFRLKRSRVTLQLTYYLIGAFPLWLSCWSHFLVSMGLNLYPAGGLFYLFHLAVLAYALFVKDLFDVTFVIRRGLPYAALSLLSGILYGLFLRATTSYFRVDSQAHLVSTVAFVTLLGFICSPLLAVLQRQVDRLFFRSQIDRASILQRFTLQMSGSICLDEIADKLSSLFRSTLAPRFIRLYLFSEKYGLRLFSEDHGQLRICEWPLTPEFTSVPTGTGIHRFGALGPLPNLREGSHAGFVEGGESIGTPILQHERLIGYLILGPRLADEYYSTDDISLIEAAVANSSLALSNARSLVEMQRLAELTIQTLNTLTASVLVINEDGTIRNLNTSAMQLFKIDGTIEHTLQTIRAGSTVLVDAIGHSLSSMVTVSNVEYPLPDEPERIVLLTTRELAYQNERRTFLAIIHDITEYKSLQGILRRKEGLAILGETIASINHELKNIIQPLRVQIQMLAEPVSGPAQLSQAVPILSERSKALERLAHSLRDLSRPLDLRILPVRLKPLVTAVVNEVNLLPGASEIAIKTDFGDADLVCLADGHWFHQVLYNLIRNASEACASKSNGEVQISTVRQAEWVEINITDNGGGIDPGIMKKLFTPFLTTKGSAGTGLGLTLCRKIIDHHGGQLSVTNEPGLGVKITIRLASAP